MNSRRFTGNYASKDRAGLARGLSLSRLNEHSVADGHDPLRGESQTLLGIENLMYKRMWTAPSSDNWQATI
jgi:hypothetical protein